MQERHGKGPSGIQLVSMCLLVAMLAASCGGGSRPAVRNLARLLGTSTDDAARYLDDAVRFGATEGAFVRTVRQSRSFADEVRVTISTLSLEDFVRTWDDEVLVSAMCDVLADAVVQGTIPSFGEMTQAFVSAAVDRWGVVPALVSTVTDVAEDIEQLYTFAPNQYTGYARILVLKYRYC